MTDRKVVMISSTARDLPQHREQVRLACERAGFEPREMMEHLTALNTDAVDISLRMVDEADVYIGVFAYRYGYVPDGHDISITEMEYNRAVATDKPRLIFFMHDEHPVIRKDVETGAGATKLEALKARIGKQRVAAYFTCPQDLRGHVVEALTALSKQLDAADSGQASLSAATKLHRRTAIPAPPVPYVAHPYTLSQVRDLVGRQAELNWLTDWVTNSASPAFGARLFCFVAIGGMGKSALTWKWFQQIAPQEMHPLAGRLWWSFYESDASFENFLMRALAYVSEQSEAEVKALPRPDREAQLLSILDEQPFLCVLDGLERILLAYHRMDASYLAEWSLWLRDFTAASTLADWAWALAGVQRFERDFIHAALLQGQAALGLSDPERADERLHLALARSRAVNVVEFALPALIAIAELESQRGHLADARARLDEVWDAIACGPYPLYQADAYNVLADIERAESNTQAAIEAATRAYRAAWCNGPPYAYHWGLEKAKAHLTALNAPEPEMPAFDASTFEPLPEVEINPQDEHWVDPATLD
jgi:hypothetical protein